MKNLLFCRHKISNAVISGDTMLTNNKVPINRDDIEMKFCELYVHHTLSRPTELMLEYEYI